MAVRPRMVGLIDLPEDFRDLLIELHDAGAEFVVLGGHAVAYHGHPRATKDLDVLVRASVANAARVYKALARSMRPSMRTRRSRSTAGAPPSSAWPRC